MFSIEDDELINLIRGEEYKKYNTLMVNIKKWIYPFEITEDEKKKMGDSYQFLGNIKSIKLMDEFINKLMPYIDVLGIGLNKNNLRDKTSIATSVIFYYGAMIYKYHFDVGSKNNDDLYKYTILYLLMDQYIDDINLDENIKNQAILQMAILIKDPETYKNTKLVDPILKYMVIIYIELINKYPNIKDVIINIFNVQIKGHINQKFSNLDREVYYKISADKGGYTSQVLSHIFEMKDSKDIEYSYDIGVIVQLLDECSDIREDRLNNIYTIAIYDLDNKGFLDDICIDMINRISILGNKYTIIKIMLTYYVILLISKNPQYYSSKLKNLIKPYNIFQYIDEKHGLNIIANYIIEYINKKLSPIYLDINDYRG